MLAILRSEIFKFRKANIWALIFVGPVIAIFAGLVDSSDLPVNSWVYTVLMMNLVYAVLFLPLITGVFASIVCRYEHQAGGWKQLLALPVTKGRVFLAKYLLLIGLVFLMQLLYLGAIYLVGNIQGFADPFPLEIIWKSVLGGWIATFPLIALQLWLAIWFKSFAAPFAVNVIFTIPTILALNSEKLAPFYPWAQPYLMMNVGGKVDTMFFVPWDQLLIVVGGSFILFFLGGYFLFNRKAF
ncbi:ABC transporter permease [Paraliobacillus ryukyuensis]|uniref:ABC transporter permease n=1 Tax=Paraliobacillus ryukyuensis TaxID=200904 RepID=UPI0009A69F92|nr:ABC transporter permease [Paraliobacillus ryukyuensis]